MPASRSRAARRFSARPRLAKVRRSNQRRARNTEAVMANREAIESISRRAVSGSAWLELACRGDRRMAADKNSPASRAR
jgi:hypothetical protein